MYSDILISPSIETLSLSFQIWDICHTYVKFDEENHTTKLLFLNGNLKKAFLKVKIALYDTQNESSEGGLKRGEVK